MLSNRLWWCLGLLLLLEACRTQPRTAAPATTAYAPQTHPWAATIADRLYERQILSAAGRDTLQQRIAAHALRATYQAPGRAATYADTLADPATVLAFCSELFQQELFYRLDFGHGYSSLSDSGAARLRQRFAAALHDTHGDTAAAARRLASPPQLIESQIRAEDSLSRTGWTIYPPLSALPAAITPGIAATRSVMGKTRTRTARDFYELGLVSEPHYAVLRRELAAGTLTDEVRLSQRAAELALETVSYPARRLAYDSLLARLTAAGVLPTASHQHLLADSQALRQLALFDILPYCAHARVLDLDSLSADPHQRYPRLLAAIASVGPSFQYSAAQVRVREHRLYDAREQLATLAFTAGGRRYATTFVLDVDMGATERADAHNRSLGYLPTELPMLLNQYLRDQGSAARLYLTTPDQATPARDDTRVGLLLLTPVQRAAWGPAMQLLEEAGGPDTLFTSARIEQALALYQRLGLLASLSKAELAEGREQALSGKVGSYAALLACFPRLVVYTCGEDAEQPHAYAQALRQVAAASRGAFRPTRIHDTFGGESERKQHSTLSFWSGGRRYRTTLTSDLGWMINDFTDLVQRAVRETTGGQLYYLGYGDETGLYLYLTAAQATALRRAQPMLFREHDADQARAQRRR